MAQKLPHYYKIKLIFLYSSTKKFFRVEWLSSFLNNLDPRAFPFRPFHPTLGLGSNGRKKKGVARGSARGIWGRGLFSKSSLLVNITDNLI